MDDRQSLSQLKEKIEALDKKKTVSSCIEFFLQNQKSPYLYFEYSDALCALKAVYAKPSSLPLSGKWIRLYESDPQFHIRCLDQPLKIKPVSDMAVKIFPRQKIHSYTLSFKGSVQGVFLLKEGGLFVENFFNALKMKCSALSWKKQYSRFSNKDYFLKILFSEISRARELKLPVSVLVINCLSYEEMIKSGEEKNMFLLFKSLYNHISKNSRNYDTTIQISPHELALILPHASQGSAVEKAEKFYWILKSLNYKEMFSLDQQARFQIGAAEYPKAARDAVELLKTARFCAKENSQERQSGGVCVASGRPGFKPDFEADCKTL